MNKREAESLLHRMLGDDAVFRAGQWEAIHASAVLKQRLLVVQRTGWGKSIVYFIATKMLRDRGSGPALLISPLLALMRNQVDAARKIGLRPLTINSENVAEWTEARAALNRNECDILLISPERLANHDFRTSVLNRIQNSIGLFIVDEAHCISDWGHDFRPDYRRIVRIVRLLPSTIPVICTTATANDRVVHDVVAQIPNLHLQRGPLTRQSLRLFNIALHDQSERLAWLAQFIAKLPGSGIIYCLTIPDTRRVAGWLQQNGISALEYNSKLEAEDRLEAERSLIGNECKALVATVALGMGFDKPDLGFVIHFQRPGSVIAYYQQVGRAGRAVDEAYGILLSGREDDDIQDYFIRSAFPPAEVMALVLRAVEQRPAVNIGELTSELNLRRGVIDKALKLLEVDGAVIRDGRTFIRTTNAWHPDQTRSDHVTRNRRDELAEIKRYVEHPGCLMEFLSRALDDPAPSRCGKCMNCSGQTQRQVVSQHLINQAIHFLRRDEVVVHTRKQWPTAALDNIQAMMPGAVGLTKQGKPSLRIPGELLLAEGRALSIYGDAGWGLAVVENKYETKSFREDLIAATARLIRERWRPEPFPEWVTCVPSNRQPLLVANFAKQLAKTLNLPYVPVITKIRDTEPQKRMENSVQQVRNLLGAFAVERAILNTPVLLVDDVIDSGWTLTVIGILLRIKGSGPVFPFALARATPSDA